MFPIGATMRTLCRIACVAAALVALASAQPSAAQLPATDATVAPAGRSFAIAPVHGERRPDASHRRTIPTILGPAGQDGPNFPLAAGYAAAAYTATPPARPRPLANAARAPPAPRLAIPAS